MAFINPAVLEGARMVARQSRRYSGFGWVFNTSYRIIVGVKYCFRYNARNRQMRLAEDGEPINMENMPRPHRRRREKKLMTMDEVNEKFPMLKYKTWVASRAQEGLPTRGGVSVSPSRANSIHDADGIAPELPSKERVSTEDRPTTSVTSTSKPEQNPQPVLKESTSSAVDAAPRASTDSKFVPTVSETAIAGKEVNRASQDDEDDEDEHINAALPPECMGTSGDTCAICIDTLEDDDDVRGLTCGHAFHAACLDPWLTSRRACCPLCKADYYTPKTRPPAAEPGDAAGGAVATPFSESRGNRMNMPNRPRHTFLGLRRPGRMMGTNQLAVRTRTAESTAAQPHNADRPRLFGRPRQGNVTPSSPSSPTSVATTQSPDRPGNGSFFSGFRTTFPNILGNRGRNSQPRSDAATASSASQGVSPSNLEAGVRTTAS
ncbi:hypothetical protein B0T26DRAFT_630869 [Lasiosphaeria miniovina]|uniref:RING-type domain-containing protein n=1 Tax=Lasiosphaeria miniovina TaxID=1954250 RepID=A0AA40BIW7_9PEZI|nr:uncharacterized protein B0T26DRAFT_630869 [Lasiosphaeria miniovina]KAK0735042.1 hypothetical protein B0T26DRAFT_630869 [Lasiosphaeria miniovina]